MFITAKRHEREKQRLIGAGNGLTEALLESTEQGLLLLDAGTMILPQVSRSLSTLFRRRDFSALSFEKLLAPLVTAKTLTVARSHMAALLDEKLRDGALESNPLKDIDIRLSNPDGSFDAAHYCFEFNAVETLNAPRIWLVRISDITARVRAARELEDLRAQVQLHGEVLTSVLRQGGARFAAFLQRTGASMKTIGAVLKKPAREADAFRRKLDETLDEVDRIRREGAAFKVTGLEAAARQFEDALHELRSRSTLSGSDFLPLTVKLDHLFGQFALLRSLTAVTAAAKGGDTGASGQTMTENGTQIIEAPIFAAMLPDLTAVPGLHRSAPAGSLENTLMVLTEHVAQEHHKTVVLHCGGLQAVPSQYLAVIKNVAIQLIRNAVMHGIEIPPTRTALGKPIQGTLHLQFKPLAGGGYDLMFEDDGCGLNPAQVRTTAIARGVVSGEAASKLRDREVLKLIFKSGFTTLKNPRGGPTHGTGMALVRRYVHEAGGKIALASLMGHETRFKISLPALAAADAQVA